MLPVAAMFGPLGFPELLFILVLALLIFGPKRLPEVGRTIGKGMAQFRRATTDLKRTIETEMLPVVRDEQLALIPFFPLASGLLTGKYRNGIPEDSRAAMPRMSFLVEGLTDPAKNAAVVASVASPVGVITPDRPCSARVVRKCSAKTL